MNEEQEIERLIAEAFCDKPWLGGYPIEEAIEVAIEYRRQLRPEEREVYDRQIRLGQYPLFAIETVEIVSGRLKPQGADAVRYSILTKEP